MVDNFFYELNYDTSKNRIYLKVKGYWPSADVVSDYLKDWKTIMAEAKPGVTVLVDVTEMKPPPDDVKEIHQKAQKFVVDHGVKKVAEVSTSALTKLAVDRLSNASGMITIKGVFSDAKSAESWLNE